MSNIETFDAEVVGDTYSIKDLLKEYGFYWNDRSWMISFDILDTPQSTFNQVMSLAREMKPEFDKRNIKLQLRKDRWNLFLSELFNI